MTASMSGSSPPEHPRLHDRRPVLDQEARAHGDVRHPERLERDAECADRLAVPVREERHVDAERLRPSGVRPRRVARDRERPDAGRREILTPVPQEQELVRSGRRPVPDVEAEERVPGAEHLPKRDGLLARRRPHLDVGDGVAWAEHGASLTARRQSAQHQPSTRGNVRERNWSETFETARMPAPSGRTKTHWSAALQLATTQLPVRRPREPRRTSLHRRTAAARRSRPDGSRGTTQSCVLPPASCANDEAAAARRQRGGPDRRRTGPSSYDAGACRARRRRDRTASARRADDRPSCDQATSVGTPPRARRHSVRPPTVSITRSLPLRSGCEDEALTRLPGDEPVGSPRNEQPVARSRRRATTRSPLRSTYAIRVSVSLPVQRGERTPGRASVQRTSPSGSSAASSFSRAATTKRPKGDQLASR